MAVIKYSALVDQLRGKLNGTVFSRFNAGFNSYKKGQPSRVGSQAQQERRQQMQIASQAWGQMTPAQRTNWITKANLIPVKNRLGEDVHLSGFNYFTKTNMLFQTAGIPILLDVSSGGNVAYSFDPVAESLSITQVGGNYVISEIAVRLYVLSTSPSSSRALVYISQPIPRIDSNYNSTYYYVGDVGNVANRPIGQNFLFTATDVVMPSGWYTYPGAYHVIQIKPITRFGAVEGITAYTRFQGTYTPPAPPVWALTWAFPSNASRYTELINSGGTWIAGATGFVNASVGFPLTGSPGDYNIQLAVSPNLQASDGAYPSEFDVPRPTHTGTLESFGGPSQYYNGLLSGTALNDFLNVNFSYVSADGYKYQPFAIRIQNPTTGAWSPWGYSSIWLPIF